MKYKKTVLLFAVFCLSVPFWSARFETLIGRGLFITPSSFLILGLTAIGGLLAIYLLPDSAILAATKTAQRTQTYFSILSKLYLLLFFVGLVLINRYIVHSFFSSGDEHSCYFLAECIRSGKWFAAAHPLNDFFEVVHVGTKGGKWFSVYPPGWPILFALGLELNIADLINPLLTIFSMIFIYKIARRVYGFQAAIFGVAACSLAPFFDFTSASYFSHTTPLLTISVFIFSFLKWKDTGKASWIVLAACAGGYGLLTRYLTMAVFIAPFIFYEGLLLLKKKNRWSRAHTLFVLILGACVFINLWFNFIITGNFFDAPNHYLHRWERLGFHKNYTVLDASLSVLSRCFYLMDWAPPVFLILYFIAAYRWKRASAFQNLCTFSFFYIAAGYFFYYSWGGNQYGPRYYIEAFPLMTIAVGSYLRDLWTSNSNGVRKFIVGALMVAMAGNAFLWAKQASFYGQASRERKALYVLAQSTIKEPAIVFLHGFIGNKLVMAEEDAIRNHPSLNGRIIYAHDLKEKNKLLLPYFPNRTFYRAFYDRELNRPKLERIQL